jgi:hypothetical protein
MDGELPGVEYRQVHEHLAQCPECREEHEALLQTKRLLAQLRVQEPRAELPSYILQQLHEHDAVLSGGRPFSWLRNMLEWLQSPRPFSRGLALGTSLAMCGLFYMMSRVEFEEDKIVWYPADPTLNASLPRNTLLSDNRWMAPMPPSQSSNSNLYAPVGLSRGPFAASATASRAHKHTQSSTQDTRLKSPTW